MTATFESAVNITKSTNSNNHLDESNGVNGVNGSSVTDFKSPLEELAEQVSNNAAKVTAFLRLNGYPQPSFERDAPNSTIPINSPAEVRTARQQLMEAAMKTFQLAVGPSEYLPNLALGYQYMACLRWLTHFNIFFHIPLKGSIPYGTLAEEAKVAESQLKSIARMAMTNNLFYEPEPNRIAHTATSAFFVTNTSYHDWAIFMADISSICASKIYDASKKWPGSVAKNQTAFNIAYDTDLPFFDYLKTEPQFREEFVKYMQMVRNSQGVAVSHLIEGFNWAALGKATVVDVGGSAGSVSIALANEFPDLNFIVQDLPENIEAAGSVVSLKSPLSGRIFFHGHNFFDEQPFRGADVYLLRMILHDWQPQEAAEILRRLIPAMHKDSKIVIMDTVLPRPGTMPAVEESLLRGRELTMLQTFNSHERDFDDWKDLLANADSRLKLASVVQPVGSVMAIMEVILDSNINSVLVYGSL